MNIGPAAVLSERLPAYFPAGKIRRRHAGKFIKQEYEAENRSSPRLEQGRQVLSGEPLLWGAATGGPSHRLEAEGGLRAGPSSMA